MWQFLFATLKLTRRFFSKYNCHTKVGQFCSSARANKNCHIKIDRVDWALYCKIFSATCNFFLAAVSWEELFGAKFKITMGKNKRSEM